MKWVGKAYTQQQSLETPVIQNVESTFPSDPKPGQLVFVESDKNLYFFDGEVWKQLYIVPVSPGGPARDLDLDTLTVHQWERLYGPLYMNGNDINDVKFIVGDEGNFYDLIVRHDLTVGHFIECDGGVSIVGPVHMENELHVDGSLKVDDSSEFLGDLDMHWYRINRANRIELGHGNDPDMNGVEFRHDPLGTDPNDRAGIKYFENPTQPGNMVLEIQQEGSSADDIMRLRGTNHPDARIYFNVNNTDVAYACQYGLVGAVYNADLAELFYTSLPEQPEAGLAIGYDAKNQAVTIYNPELPFVGVVSYRPGMILGGDANWKFEFEQRHRIPVALIGQVPIKAKSEVSPGDYVTPVEGGLFEKARKNAKLKFLVLRIDKEGRPVILLK